jgi:hypothetical protein
MRVLQCFGVAQLVQLVDVQTMFTQWIPLLSSLQVSRSFINMTHSSTLIFRKFILFILLVFAVMVFPAGQLNLLSREWSCETVYLLHRNLGP